MADDSTSSIVSLVSNQTTYEDVVRGVKGFAIFPWTETPNLSELSVGDVVVAVNGFIEQVLEDIRTNCIGRHVVTLDVGKSQVPRRKRAEFGRHNVRTWRLGSSPLSKRMYKRLKEEDYDGVVVLDCFTRTDLPGDIARFGASADNFALIVESLLHSLYRNVDQFVDSRGSGRKSGVEYIGAVVYLAWKLEDDEEDLA